MQNYILYNKNIINLFFNKTYYYKYIRYKRNIPFILMLGASVRTDSQYSFDRKKRNIYNKRQYLQSQKSRKQLKVAPDTN